MQSIAQIGYDRHKFEVIVKQLDNNIQYVGNAKVQEHHFYDDWYSYIPNWSLDLYHVLGIDEQHNDYQIDAHEKIN